MLNLAGIRQQERDKLREVGGKSCLITHMYARLLKIFHPGGATGSQMTLDGSGSIYIIRVMMTVQMCFFKFLRRCTWSAAHVHVQMKSCSVTFPCNDLLGPLNECLYWFLQVQQLGWGETKCDNDILCTPAGRVWNINVLQCGSLSKNLPVWVASQLRSFRGVFKKSQHVTCWMFDDVFVLGEP